MLMTKDELQKEIGKLTDAIVGWEVIEIHRKFDDGHPEYLFTVELAIQDIISERVSHKNVHIYANELGFWMKTSCPEFRIT